VMITNSSSGFQSNQLQSTMQHLLEHLHNTYTYKAREALTQGLVMMMEMMEVQHQLVSACHQLKSS
jgi:hypothetical protein